MAAILSAASLIGEPVVNLEGEDLGKVEEIMLELEHGTVAYAVLSFGGHFGFGDKLFAIPWDALLVDQGQKRVLLKVSREQLEQADGFDKHEWPDMADATFRDRTRATYGLPVEARR